MPINYDDSGQGQPIIFLHGFPFNRSMWRDQVEFLAPRGYRCIAPDLVGLGEAHDKLQFVTNAQGQTEVCATTMADMARDIAQLMDDLQIERAVVCGLSMGCYVALEFIHLFPGRVDALVLAGGRAEGPDKAEKQSREQQAKKVIEKGFAPSVENIIQSLMAPRTLAEHPDVVARVRQMVAATDPRGAAAAQRGMAVRRDYSQDLPSIEVPALIIAGRDDGVRKPIDAETLHRGIKNSRLETIADAGHLMNMERPEAFNRAAVDFLEELSH